MSLLQGVVKSRTSIILIIIVALIALQRIYENSKKGTLVTTDPGQDTVFRVSTLHFISPTVLKLRIRSNLNDSFRLNIGGLRTFRGGLLDTTLETDHYTRKFEIDYLHYRANSGQLRIEYYLP